MIEIMISRKNRLEPTLILQSVNDVTNCKRNKTEKHFFSVFIKYTHLTLIQPRLNPGIKKFAGSGIKFCNNFGIRDQNLRLKCGICRQKIYLVTTLTFSRNVSSGVSKFDFSDNFVSKNSAKMHNFTSWHCRGASLSLRSKHFQPSSLFALVPTFSTNSGGNACYASYRWANFDRFSYTLGYRRPLESRGLQRVAPVRGGALDLCPV